MENPNTVSRRFVLGALTGVSTLSFVAPSLAQAKKMTAPMPPLSAFGKLPAIEKVAISPDAKRIAMVMDRNGERALYDYNMATGKAAAAIISGDKLRELLWADEGHIMVVTSQTEKYNGSRYEQFYGLIMDIPAGKRVQVYANVQGVVTSVVTGDFYRVKMDGAYRVTASGFRQPEGVNTSEGGASATETMDRCLYAFNTTTGRGFRLDVDSRPVQGWVVKPDGSVFARSEYDNDTKTWTARMKTAKGWQTVLEVKAPYDMPWMAGMGRDGQTVLVHFSTGEDANKYFEYDGDGKRTLIDLKRNDYSPIFHPETLHLAGFQNSGSVETWIFYDPVMQKLPALIQDALPGLKTQVLDMAADPRKLLVRSEGSGDPGTYYFIDFTDGSSKEVGSSYPGLPAEWVGEKKYIEYQAADGLQIPAYITLPPDREAKNAALVVLPHGGPEAYDDDGFDWMAQALASRGYVVLQPNYRGSAGYGKDFTAKGYGEFGRKMQTDLSDGVSFLVKQGMVDPKRVAIAGGSYGGYAALAGVSLQKGIYTCAVALAGLSNLKTFLDYRREREGFDGNSYGMMYWKRFMGPDLDVISPVRHIDAVSVPVMLIHGKDDVVVPFDQSQQIYDALTRAGKPVELVVMAEEDHWLSREPSRVQSLEAMIGFLLKHNPA
ncbi:alpha/beta hydrolase family protein [Asticcacaulis solisilvae]|uniref:alpha/beta hydrolase family protein n=1 Tax=Asticcacaulis solisilvae TaxID=1217274 RepID=UPI003FD6C7E6